MRAEDAAFRGTGFRTISRNISSGRPQSCSRISRSGILLDENLDWRLRRDLPVTRWSQCQGVFDASLFKVVRRITASGCGRTDWHTWSTQDR